MIEYSDQISVPIDPTCETDIITDLLPSHSHVHMQCDDTVCNVYDTVCHVCLLWLTDKVNPEILSSVTLTLNTKCRSYLCSCCLQRFSHLTEKGMDRLKVRPRKKVVLCVFCMQCKNLYRIAQL